MSMQAAVYATTGSDEVLTVEEVPVPEPGRGEVRIRVAAWDLIRWTASGCQASSGQAHAAYPGAPRLPAPLMRWARA